MTKLMMMILLPPEPLPRKGAVFPSTALHSATSSSILFLLSSIKTYDKQMTFFVFVIVLGKGAKKNIKNYQMLVCMYVCQLKNIKC